MRIQTRFGCVFFLSQLIFMAAGSRAFCEDKTAPPSSGSAGADAAALTVLDTARRAFNDGKSDAAAERFREFLKANGQKKEAPSAHYGLALALLESPQKDAAAIIAELKLVVAQPDSSERPFALYYLATMQRKLGQDASEQAAAKPAEAAALRTTSQTHLGDAAKNFSAATEAFSGTPEREWLYRSRCDQCDMLLRLEQNKEAAELAQKSLSDTAFMASSFRELALYQNGCALFALKDYPSAGRTLSQLAPFMQVFGIHARYLMSRIHHLAGEFPEANAGYKALLADHEVLKKLATELLKNPGAMKPGEQARYESFLKPPPDFIARAQFYDALLLSEAGEFLEALAGFGAFVQKFPTSPLIDEAKLRHGFCLLQSKNYAEAVKVLQPLLTHPKLGDRALWWHAHAQAGLGDPANVQAFAPIAKSVIDALTKAADQAGVLGGTDADAKRRRSDILLELGDMQQVAKMYKEAAATFEKVRLENPASERVEEALQRQAAALNLAGLYKESDQLCQTFNQQFPKSSLIPAVWFCGAENTFLSAMGAAQDAKANENRAVWEKQFDDAIGRYQKLITSFPEFGSINAARFGMGTALYRRGRFADAYAALSSILDAERIGELAPVNYLLADCQLRQLPLETEDALQAAQLIDRAEDTARLLKKYIATQGKTPQAADALLKLGHCQLRMGVLLIEPTERQKLLVDARQTFEKIMTEMGQTSAFPMAVIERARSIALRGDIDGASNEYNRFNADPLKQSPVAPLAMMRRAVLLRTQKRYVDALNELLECRKRYEESLKKDPMRSDWIPQIQYEHAMALKESGKPAEARAIFESIIKLFEKSPEAAQAAWRAAQCRREEVSVLLTSANSMLKKPGAKPEELAAVSKTIMDSMDLLRKTAEALKSGAERLAPLAPNAPASESHLRMLYESAWCLRTVADVEVEAARQKIANDKLAKVLENLKKSAPPNSPAPVLSAPEIPLSSIPLQPAEKSAQEQYTALVTLASSSPLAARARLELAELISRRGSNDAALELLATALEDTPPLELSERIHVRIASCLIAKNEPKLALVQAQSVIKNAASNVMGEAIFIAGDAHALNKDWPNAIAQFAAFRDKDPFRNLGVLTERGLLRLGEIFALAQRWDESRQAFEMLTQRFPQSMYVYDARLGMAVAFEKTNQVDPAYATYLDVTQRTAGEAAAQAQLQMGKIRRAQKRFPEALKDLLGVAATYDVNEINAEAQFEAGQVYADQQQPAEAAKMWQSVIKDYAGSTWAETARKRLDGIK
ncbi:MAG: tetratricopeptide repeat protein [Planctomycetota bacterium]